MAAEIKNAIIEDARITSDDHGLLSAWLTLDYGGSGQAFGGYSLYLPKHFSHHDPSGPDYTGHFIWRVMEIANVTEWSRLCGKTIRVRASRSGVHAIGHIVKDDWFNPADDFERMRAALPQPTNSLSPREMKMDDAEKHTPILSKAVREEMAAEIKKSAPTMAAYAERLADIRALLSTIDALEARLEQGRAALEELHAMVWGECPALLDEDRGGCARLDMACRAFLAAQEMK